MFLFSFVLILRHIQLNMNSLPQIKSMALLFIENTFILKGDGGSIFKIICIIFAPIIIMVISESCSKMESTDGSLSGIYSSDTNVCSDIYKPTIQLTSKLQNNQGYTNPFENQKVHLENSSFNKSTSTLQNQTVIVVLHTQCQSQPGSLSDRILKANPNEHLLPSQQAFNYVIEENWDLSNLEDAAHSDSCVVGITPPHQVTTSTLPLPATSDSHLSKLTHLGFTNYTHAYEHFVKKQTSVNTLVAVIDAGAECSHPDLASNLVANCGYNLLSPGQPPADASSGHGSHVAGLIGAVGNNGQGTLGVAGAIRIQALKVLGNTATDVTYTFNGIQYAVAQNADVINLSLTGSNSQQRILSLEQAVADAVASGVVVVMAAGNHSLRLGTDAFVSPAMVGALVNGAITVGSVDAQSGRLSSFSNFGNQVEIAAPGAVDTLSDNGLYSLAPGRSYQRLMGTSQSAPIVSGAAALVIQFLKQKAVAYSPADIERIIMHSTDSAPILVNGGRSLNFSKLVRNTYEYAGINLCP